MAIPSETIEQVAAANDIVEVIGAYFPLKRAGANFRALCPFHQEKTPSFHVNPARQTFHCFGCGTGGSVFRFVMEYEHIEFPAAVKKLADRAGIRVIEERPSEDESRQHEARRTLLKLHAEAAEWFHDNLLKRELGEAARKYLKSRGLTRETAIAWKLGYAPDSWDAFCHWAREAGYRAPILQQSGLVKLKDETRTSGEFYDRFRDRLMFPIQNDIGEVIAFSGRSLQADATAAKYLNSPETPLFRKGSVLFGLHRSKRALIDANSAIICEGQLDLITLFEAGVTNVVAPQGTAFTEHQARVLKRFVSEVVLCFDADAAGQKAAERSLEALLQNELLVRVAEMPAGEDPDSFVRKFGREKFEALIAAAPDFFDYWIEKKSATSDLNSLGAKLQVARELAATASHVRGAIARGEVVNKVAARLGVRAGDFEKMMTKEGGERQRAADVRPVNAPSVAPSHEVAMLCLLALRDDAARSFLLEERAAELAQQIPGAEMLEKVLRADIRPSDPASLNRYLSSLASADEALVSAWLMLRMPADPIMVAKEWWFGMRKAILERDLEIAETRLAGLLGSSGSTGEEVVLQKQIVDLRRQLAEFPRFSPVRAPRH
ncbi:MAG: DNA primase [Verrucomicrobiota bacterium]|nr:DNA primase [Verrucomicrobiota bacterium]